MKRILAWLQAKWEKSFNPSDDLGVLSPEKLYDLNAAFARNWWYDKKGNRWPLRDSL